MHDVDDLPPTPTQDKLLGLRAEVARWRQLEARDPFANGWEEHVAEENETASELDHYADEREEDYSHGNESDSQVEEDYTTEDTHDDGEANEEADGFGPIPQVFPTAHCCPLLPTAAHCFFNLYFPHRSTPLHTVS